MNLTSPAEVKQILAKHGLRPKKRLGQNFLIDRNVLNRILDASEITPEDYVMEIGPGLGTVTVELADRAKQVVAVEADREMVAVLLETLSEKTNVEVVHADFLDFDVSGFLQEKFGRLEHRIRQKTPLHGLVQKNVCERQKAHALVMRHV
jgi:16S rRNA (adenine1518-N6/adenine1519-N6)-dimethyltransferase